MRGMCASDCATFSPSLRYSYIGMNTDQEQKLIERAKTEGAAFGELYDLYYPKILNYILRRTGDIEVSEDITTEVFMKALDRIQTFIWRGVPFSAWLYRIASHEIANHFRNKHTKNMSLETLMEEHGFEPANEVDIEASYTEAQEKIERHQQFLLVQQSLLKLPLKYQEALALRYFEKKSIAEIAGILNKRPGTIKSLLSRGVRKLQGAVLVESQAKSANATFLQKSRLPYGDKKS
jgi:RNA polymerase sigma factor (sigma-70 family)